MNPIGAKPGHGPAHHRRASHRSLSKRRVGGLLGARRSESPSDKRRLYHLHAKGRWHLGRRVNAARSAHTHTRAPAHTPPLRALSGSLRSGSLAPATAKPEHPAHHTQGSLTTCPRSRQFHDLPRSPSLDVRMGQLHDLPRSLETPSGTGIINYTCAFRRYLQVPE